MLTSASTDCHFDSRRKGRFRDDCAVRRDARPVSHEKLIVVFFRGRAYFIARVCAYVSARVRVERNPRTPAFHENKAGSEAADVSLDLVIGGMALSCVVSKSLVVVAETILLCRVSGIRRS